MTAEEILKRLKEEYVQYYLQDNVVASQVAQTLKRIIDDIESSRW